MIVSIAPESSTVSARPSRPICAVVAATRVMKAPRRAADLIAAAAERRDDEAADDGGVKPAIRRHARGDRNRHRQRQGDDRDGEPGDDVATQPIEAVALPQHGVEFGLIEMCGGGAVGHGSFRLGWKCARRHTPKDPEKTRLASHRENKSSQRARGADAAPMRCA